MDGYGIGLWGTNDVALLMKRRAADSVNRRSDPAPIPDRDVIAEDIGQLADDGVRGHRAMIATALFHTSRSVTRQEVGNEAEDRIKVICDHARLIVDEVTGVSGSKERFHASDGVVEVRCLVHAGRLCSVDRFGQTVPMTLALLILALAPGEAPASSSARLAWESCLQSYAQVESLGSSSDFAIAEDALSACFSDESRYVEALNREVSGAPPSGGTSGSQVRQRLAPDQRQVTIRLIAFIRRLRQS